MGFPLFRYVTKNFWLAMGMLFFGSINTIASKYQDAANFAKGSTYYGKSFNHPLFQTSMMFIGEFLCLIAFGVQHLYKKHQRSKQLGTLMTEGGLPEPQVIRFNPFIFALPALCDTTATTMMYVGLLLTYASVYQMIRGAVVVFTAIFSVLFLKKRLRAYHWIGVVVIVIGTIVVGLYSILAPGSNEECSDSSHGSVSGSDSAAPNPLLGDVLVITAQVIVAVQMVVEEKFIAKYKVPALLVVGFEGIYGLIYTTILLVILGFAPVTLAGVPYDSAIEAFHMMASDITLFIWVLVGIFSIAFFNFFGISVTSELSAAHRMILDTCRTLLVTSFALMTNIWATCLEAWQPISAWLALQFLGFLILVGGALIYFEVVKLPRMNYEKDTPTINGDEPHYHHHDHKQEKGLLLGDHRGRRE
eukprot:TRINITY_DN5874_c0_g1_i1.p1 TRINITY_DN5874_c0_g1~~TRINITY_DN5874_c0_g1_i1.p1  ORF type:complete len:417 (-),score=101.39 TRINITY_DN5874_c0_g1_i1:185-1435(-)